MSFEDVEVAIKQGNVLDIVAHPKRDKYPDQRIFVVRILDYVYLVPFVEDQGSYFLKTMILSRKATKQYLGVIMPKKSKLNKEEQEILNSFERSEWESTNPTAAELHKFQKIARASLANDKRINVRLPARVLEGIQLGAAQEGVP